MIMSQKKFKNFPFRPRDLDAWNKFVEQCKQVGIPANLMLSRLVAWFSSQGEMERFEILRKGSQKPHSKPKGVSYSNDEIIRDGRKAAGSASGDPVQPRVRSR